jgi:hypothetical protein
VHLGVNLPIKVPSYRIFNQLLFVPGEGCREHVYLDDVLVKWVPTLHDSPPGSVSLLNVDFESDMAETTKLDGASGLQIVTTDQSPEPFFVEKTTSYGSGVHCLRARGGGSLMADFRSKRSLESSKSIIVDLDFFIRSDQGFPYLLPDPSTRSAHHVVIALVDAESGQQLAAVDSAKGTWQLRDGGHFVDTNKQVQYDIWNHLQLAIDPTSHTYRVTVQPIGELPTLIGRGTLNPLVMQSQSLQLVIKPSATAGHISCYDNLRVTRD